MATEIYQRVCLVLYIWVLWIALSHGDKEIILKEPTKGERWHWQSAPPWVPQGTFLRKCTICSQQMFYVRTPFILIPPLVRTIDVIIVYKVQNCSNTNAAKICPDNPNPCSEEFDLRKYESSKSLTHEEVGPELFNDTVKTIKSPNPGKNSTDVTAVNVNSAGVYFGLFDKKVCQDLYYFEVSYRICSRAGANLLVFETTPVPATGYSNTTSGRCVENSVLAASGTTPRAVCDSNGDWIVDSNATCFCNPGYQPSADFKRCVECPQGTFKAGVGNEPCRNCSAKSVPYSNRTGCGCVENYLRINGETNCTGKPSAPVNVLVNSLSAEEVTLIWEEPTETGGRDDLVYNVQCEVFTKAAWEICPPEVGFKPKNEDLKQTKVSLFKLRPYTKYKIIIASRNGISNFLNDKNPDITDTVIMTNQSIPGEVKDIRTRWLNGQTLNIKWTMDNTKKNGRILGYQVRYYQKDLIETATVVNTTESNINISGLSSETIYKCEVRAKTEVGFGNFTPVDTPPPTTATVPLKPPFNLIALIVGSCAAAIVMLLIICCAVMYRRREKKEYVPGGLDVHPGIPLINLRTYVDPGEYGDLFVLLKTFAREIDRTLVTLEKIIGGGEFGDVYQGMLKLEEKKSEKVAVKVLKAGASIKSRDDFLTEASIMGQFKHENVLEMKGVILSSPIMIVLEFMENGALNNFLKQNDGKLTNLELLGMALDVAKGMNYLSKMNFIHRDLSARNILVSAERICKVADFGLSREIADDNPESEYLTQGGKIPVRWTALEAFKFRKFSIHSDVWSFGVLAWEIMSFGERPYWQWDNYEVMNQVERGYRLPAPMGCPKVIHTMMKECWRENRTQRPDFEDLVQGLDQLISSPNLLNDDMADKINWKRKSINFEEINNVDEWLDQINMAVYKPNFMEAGLINLGHVIDIDDNTLKVIGVDVVGHRNAIKKSVKTMRNFLNENAEEGEI